MTASDRAPARGNTYLLRTQSSGAGIVAIGSTGGDLINMLKQAREFGLGKDKQRVARFVLTLAAEKVLMAHGTLVTANGQAFLPMAIVRRGPASTAALLNAGGRPKRRAPRACTVAVHDRTVPQHRGDGVAVGG
jgi:hypothetical protein